MGEASSVRLDNILSMLEPTTVLSLLPCLRLARAKLRAPMNLLPLGEARDAVMFFSTVIAVFLNSERLVSILSQWSMSQSGL